MGGREPADPGGIGLGGLKGWEEAARVLWQRKGRFGGARVNPEPGGSCCPHTSVPQRDALALSRLSPSFSPETSCQASQFPPRS